MNLSPSFQQIETLVRTTYSDEWKRIFPQDRGLFQADLVILSEAGGGCFSMSRNLMILKIGDGFSNYDLDAKKWPVWTGYLVHEIVHEYEFKVLQSGWTEEGVVLHQKVQAVGRNFDPHYQHEAPFYTALVSVGQHYEFSGWDLFKKL